MKSEKERLKEILIKKCVRTGVKRILSSGRESNYYIDAKFATMDPEGSFLIAKLILEHLRNYEVEAIGGYTLGADPIVGSVVALSHQSGRPLLGFIVRKEPKTHGEMKQIEGPFRKGLRTVIVDDVITTGSSIIKSAKAVESEGGIVVLTMGIVDRLEGGKENIENEGYIFQSLFTRKDLEIE
ncbi:MAG: orotate phosphoribosyltransferase [Candidatus Aminicenantia bacterium]